MPSGGGGGGIVAGYGTWGGSGGYPGGIHDVNGGGGPLSLGGGAGCAGWCGAARSWTLRALSAAGNGDAVVQPSGAGIHEVDVKIT